MASTNLGSLATFLTASQFSPQSSCSRFSPLYSLGLNKWREQQQRQLQLGGIKICQAKPRGRRRNHALVSASATTLDSFFGGGEEGTGSSPPTLEEMEKDEKPKCPPGLRHYETMAVLRPDISEEDRLALTQRYEEKIVAGGGMGVEVFNRGFIPLAYAIRKKTLSGQKNTYFDGIYLLFTYFTKPEGIPELEKILNKDDDIIRASTFKVRERKY